jgi:hypothetical protein
VCAWRISSDLFQRAAEGGLFRQFLARQLGRLGRSPAEKFETDVEMARLEASFCGGGDAGGRYGRQWLSG